MLKTPYLESNFLIEAEDVNCAKSILIDARFSLSDPDLGRQHYEAGHIPGAFYLDLEKDLSGFKAQHGGRHPLPDPKTFATCLARCGISKNSQVIIYDDFRMAFASRLWWMMKSLDYLPPKIINGGYKAWLALGNTPENTFTPSLSCEIPQVPKEFRNTCDIDMLRDLQSKNLTLVDSREHNRYLGLEELIDPVAGHIPGALNRPWVSATDDSEKLLSNDMQSQRWGDILESEKIVVYCGSGVTACVNLFSLHACGRDDAILYPGSWSDWCSYL
tara:strand:+ start:533 stop:1354 length:822 start_codon:yes stop_codon:yes gene_type:complete